MDTRSRHQCKKRKPKYTSRVSKSKLSLSHYARRKHLLWLRPRSYLLLCNVKIKELVPPWLLSARQTPSFLSRRHTQRNRSTGTKAGTRPQTKRSSSVATVSNALGDTAVQFASEHLTPLPWADASTGKLDSRFPIHNLPSKVVETIPNCYDIQIT